MCLGVYVYVSLASVYLNCECVCLLNLGSAFLSVCLFLTLKPAHPPGQALRPALCGHFKWAVAEMVVLWLELAVAVSGIPWVRQCSDTLTPHKGVLQEEGREVLCGSWKRGVKIPLLSVLTSRKKGPEAAQPAEQGCLATRRRLYCRLTKSRIPQL